MKPIEMLYKRCDICTKQQCNNCIIAQAIINIEDRTCKTCNNEEDCNNCSIMQTLTTALK